MTRRLLAVLGAATVWLVMATSAAAGLPSTSLASISAEPSAATAWPDRSVVMQPVPGEPCAAPVFGPPEDAGSGPILAETGVDRVLQVAGILALALAALLGAGRPWTPDSAGSGTPV